MTEFKNNTDFILEQCRLGLKMPTFVIALVLLVGIIFFNNNFAYLGIPELDISLFLSLLLLIVGVTGVPYARSWRTFIERESLLYLVVLLYACFKLITSHSYYSETFESFLILAFISILHFAFKSGVSQNMGIILIRILVLLGGLFNGTKIVVFKFLGATLNNYETLRVFHNEVDIIWASISLLALVAIPSSFHFQRKYLRYFLVVLNLIVIILSFKRTVVVGLGVTMPLIYFSSKDKNSKKCIRELLVISIVTCSLLLAFLYAKNKQSFDEIQNYIVYRASLGEKNAQWRLNAWEMAYETFTQSPILGVNLSEPILKFPVDNIISNYPHNSLLTIASQYGIVGLILFVSLILQSLFLIIKRIRSKDHASVFLFYLMGLAFLFNFSLFNVTVENHAQVILFAFFLTTPFLKLKEEQNENALELIETNRYHLTRTLVFAYILFYFTIGLKGHRISIYSVNRSLAYKNQQPVSLGETFEANTPKGLNLSSKGAYYELKWLLPEKVKLKKDIQLYDYKLVVKYVSSSYHNDVDSICFINSKGERWYVDYIEGDKSLSINMEKLKDMSVNINDLQSFVLILKGKYHIVIKEVFFERVT